RTSFEDSPPIKQEQSRLLVADINIPSSPIRKNDSAYQIEFKFALEPSLTRLFEKARSAGWDPR
ncbi:hypothetical protein ACC699_40040, partial [Rhizobium ruizarguesonis]